MKDLGITHILNMTEEIPNSFDKSIYQIINITDEVAYENVKISDTEETQISTYFDQTYQFINKALNQKESEPTEVKTKNKNELDLKI